jgi:hypothetical protein
MSWIVLFHYKFEEWFDAQEASLQEAIASHIVVLEEQGPHLGRPYVDTLKDSQMTNLKELRVQHKGEPWRILFVFDRKRSALLLVGGNKAGDRRWYKKNILIAEERYREFLEEE